MTRRTAPLHPSARRTRESRGEGRLSASPDPYPLQARSEWQSPGRPKGSKSIDQVLRQALQRRVPDPRRGTRHTVPMIEIIVEGLVLGAAKRDPRMLRLLLALIDRYAPSDAPTVEPDEVRATDREILEEYVASVTAALDKQGEER